MNLSVSEYTYYHYTAFFRVFLALHIFKKYVYYLPYVDKLFGHSSFYGKYDDIILQSLGIGYCHSLFVITIILALSILMAFGLGMNLTVLLLFISIDIVQRKNGYLLNGGDNLFKIRYALYDFR